MDKKVVQLFGKSIFFTRKKLYKYEKYIVRILEFFFNEYEEKILKKMFDDKKAVQLRKKLNCIHLFINLRKKN